MYKYSVRLKKRSNLKRLLFFVRMRGFEPPHLTALPPEDSVSTNFTTCAVNRKARQILSGFLVGTTGFEPVTPCL